MNTGPVSRVSPNAMSINHVVIGDNSNRYEADVIHPYQLPLWTWTKLITGISRTPHGMRVNIDAIY
jgi:hypothetical protein